MKLFLFIKELYQRFRDDEISSLGAVFTFYLILAFFPFLIILANLATYTDLVGDKALLQLAAVLPTQAYQLVYNTVHEIMSANRSNVLSVSTVACLWAASNGFMAIARGLNKAYDVKETRKFWLLRILAIVYTLLLIASNLLGIIMVVFGELILESIAIPMRLSVLTVLLSNVIRITLPMLVCFLVFALMNLYIPNRRLTFKQVMPGALISTFLWMAGSLLFSYYVSNFANYTRTYGSLGGVIILILWIYLTSFVLLIGSEVNATSAALRAKAPK